MLYGEADRLKNKFVLLDTNVLIDSAKYLREYMPFFDLLRELETSSMIDLAIQLEFIRGAKNTKDVVRQKEFLNLLLGPSSQKLVPTPEIFDLAQDIGLILNRCDGNKKPSLGDCLIGAQAAKYSNEFSRLFIATQNHVDFPPILYETVFTYTITLSDGKIKNIGVYAFKDGAYKTLLKDIKGES